MSKRTYSFLLIFLLVSMVWSGCKKDEVILISGLISDPNQGIPVEEATVEVWTQHIESGIFVANYILEGTQETGPDGRFLFNLPPRSYTGIKLIFSREGYYGWESPLNAERVKNDHGSEAVYQLLPKAFLQIHVVNTEPFDGADYFEFRILNGYASCDECCKGEKYQFYGMGVDQVIECQVVGHQEIVIQWSKRKDKKQVFENKTTFVKAFETTKINFNY